MIKKIKDKIKRFESELESTRQLQEDHLALTQLLKMFNDQTFVPLTSWSVSPKEVLHICNDIILNKRKSIVEFGSGFSTICIAQLLKINKVEARFITVENQVSWAEDLKVMLKKFDLADFVQIITAPIADVPADLALGGQRKWYDVDFLTEGFASVQNIDVVIVDGPFGGTTPFARYSAIPYLKEKMATDFSVFLDDSSRNDETRIASEWQKILKSSLKSYKRYIYLTNRTNFDIAPFGNKF
ncbi:MAG TPA: hypothetical protein VF581_04795 [Flavobacterium sp.]|jgi:hypothetical protein